jgi:hypothetical protein
MLDVIPIYSNMKPNLPKSNSVLRKDRPMNDLSPLTIPVAAAGGPEIGLHEPSFETAIAAIAADPDLPADVKNHWSCSLRRVAAFLDRPMVLVPARWTAVRIPASRLKATRLGVTQKTPCQSFVECPGRARLDAPGKACAGPRHAPLA